jgi:uncharacterized membrane protein YfcA
VTTIAFLIWELPKLRAKDMQFLEKVKEFRDLTFALACFQLVAMTVISLLEHWLLTYRDHRIALDLVTASTTQAFLCLSLAYFPELDDHTQLLFGLHLAAIFVPILVFARRWRQQAQEWLRRHKKVAVLLGVLIAVLMVLTR